MLKKKSICKVTVLILAVFIFSSGYFIQRAKSEDKVPNLRITIDQSTVNAGVNEEFTVNYHIEPQPIPVAAVNPQVQKEIVLVVDTSGSMSNTLDSSSNRIGALKTAAKNFIDKFAGNENVSIGIVDYDTSSKIITKTSSSQDGFITTSTANVPSIKNLIDTKLDANGGTNIGDGIRKALSILNRPNNKKKYIILMSDGEPTALTYTGQAGYNKTSYDHRGRPNGTYYSIEEQYDSRNGFWAWDSNFEENTNYWNYYTNFNDDTSTMKYGGIYSNDSDKKGLFLKYSNLMAQKIKAANITSYFIGFSNDSNSNKMSQIATNAGGYYYDARDGQAINTVYSQLADQIKADYTVEDVKLSFSLPQNISYTGSTLNTTVNGTSYVQQIPNISYTLNSSKTYYEAKPFDITITMKATKSGVYTLGTNGWVVSYKGVNGTVLNETLPNINITVSTINMTFDMNRELISSSNSIGINKSFQIKYNVVPKPIVRTVSTRAKEVVLVLDNSSSMTENLNGETNKPVNEQKISILKQTAKNFVSRLNGNSDVKVGIVSYNNGGNSYNFGNGQYLTPCSNTSAINSAIDSITASGGSNLGDGIRKAIWELSQNNNARKYVVVISDGNADYYTYDKANTSNFYTSIDNESASGTKVDYAQASQPDGNGKIKSEEYSKQIAPYIKTNQLGQQINSYFITLGKNGNASLLTELANTAAGVFKDCSSSDKSIFNNTMLDIADVVRSEFIIDSLKLTEALPDGLAASDNIAAADLSKLVYVYNKAKGQYEADPVSAILNVKGTKIGNYNLSNDASVAYKDLEGNPITKYFQPLSVSIVDEYVLKQGLFVSRPTDSTITSESYIKEDSNSKNIADNFTASAAVYLKTSGQSTTMKVDINKDLNSNIKNINISSYKLYELDANNQLKEVSNAVTLNKISDNYYVFTVNIPQGEAGKYHEYILNYNFKSQGNSNSNYDIKCSASIQETGKIDDLLLHATMMPDLF